MKPAVFHLGKGIEVERETCTALPPVVATEGVTKWSYSA